MVSIKSKNLIDINKLNTRKFSVIKILVIIKIIIIIAKYRLKSAQPQKNKTKKRAQKASQKIIQKLPWRLQKSWTSTKKHKN